MLDQLKSLKALASVMGNADELKEKFARVQEELGNKFVEADAGAGAVRVTANGKLEITAVRIDPAMLSTLAGEGSDEDKALVEELIAAATNAALKKSRELASEELGKAAGDMNLNLPGLDKILGQIGGQ